MTNTERPITESTTDELIALHAEGTQVMDEAIEGRSRAGYQIARQVVEVIEAELNSRGLFAQEDEDFNIIGWAA